MDDGDRSVPPWGVPPDTSGDSGGPQPGDAWQGNRFGGPNGPQQGGPPQGAPQWGSPGESQGSMTSFPLAATGAYAAVRPPEPPPMQAAPQAPPPMTSFPLAATGAYQAVGQQGSADLSASGFRAVPGMAPEPGSQYYGPMGPGGPPGAPPGGGTGKHRRALFIGASALAVAGVAAGAIAFATSGDGKKQPGPASPTASGSAQATGPGGQNISGSGTPSSSRSGQNVPSGTPSSSPSKPVAAPAADLLHWRLNDKVGSTTAADGSGKNHAGALSGAAGFSTAHGGSAEFSGAANQIKAGQIQTKGPAVDTTKSFTVSMWVDQTGLTTPTKFAAAFSQDGPQCFAFTFSYSTESKTWSFVRSEADSANPKTVNAGATAPTPMNTWVKLTGVYDAQAGTIAFFVNGVPQGGPAKTGSAPYAATGPFAIGRSWYGKFVSNPFKGYISDVQVFSRALSADEVKAL
ncbi:LamG domain-containing protein [Catenulispora rubra]|uniref:LamG domain-containing protein n=1 Tax=Catenulispora rubra TaxID=280293 RepID=UPI001891F507|nr:LamG domain-containing protein [Catenulispora rubra]